MNRSHRTLPALALLALACLCPPLFAASPPPTCPVAKSMTCPKTFEIIETVNSQTPVVIQVGDPIEIYHHCLPRVGGMTCEGWPQEYDTIGYLTYQWTIRVGYTTTTYPVTTNPVRNIQCSPLQTVSARLTVTNGSYSASSTHGYGCGNEIP